MKGDFSRVIFNGRDNYIMTLMQQGRVQTDSDWNAHVIQHWAYLKNMTAVLLGEHGGPEDHGGEGNGPVRGHFKIMAPSETVNQPYDFSICEGAYFVDGEMCINHNDTLYFSQPDWPEPEVIQPDSGNGVVALIYLSVWMRHITAIEDPIIREIALGDPDTTTRIQRIWQVKALDVSSQQPEGINLDAWADALKKNYNQFRKLLPEEETLRSARLTAKVKDLGEDDDPCILPPQAGYRGMENQLYRVEVLCGGRGFAPDEDIRLEDCEAPYKTDACSDRAVFVWSRDNGSITYPIDSQISGATVTLKKLWLDDRCAIAVGNWVEISDEIAVLQRDGLPLRRVTAVDTEMMQVTLSAPPSFGGRDMSQLPLVNPIIRRWDHSGSDYWSGGIPVVCGSEEEPNWIELENGICISFRPRTSENGNGTPSYSYRKGDWWWIPARTITGDIQWPADEDGKPEPLNPMHPDIGIAPLALIQFDDQGNTADNDIYDVRRQFRKIWKE